MLKNKRTRGIKIDFKKLSRGDTYYKINEKKEESQEQLVIDDGKQSEQRNLNNQHIEEEAMAEAKQEGPSAETLEGFMALSHDALVEKNQGGQSRKTETDGEGGTD